VDYTYNGETRDIRFLHRDLGFINIDNPIPIYVAGNNPRVLRAAGEYGDGLVFGRRARGNLVPDSPSRKGWTQRDYATTGNGLGAQSIQGFCRSHHGAVLKKTTS
jgi:hypothetical protein